MCDCFTNLNILYPLVFLTVFLLTIFSTLIIRNLAERGEIVDVPDKERKKHEAPVPLLGGLAIFLPLFTVLFFFRDFLTAGNLGLGHWLGFFAGGLILMAGGFLDDKFDLPPAKQFIFPVLAAAAVIAGGVEIEKVGNPFGGFFYLNRPEITLLDVSGPVFKIALLSDLLVILWLLGMMYTTKLLDGVDGLVSGVVLVGALVIFLFTMTTKYYQPDIGLASLALAAACLGFLVFNWHPARIFLGEGGSLFLGYALGVLAIISGGKIAIALLVMGIPILDVAWTIVRRLAAGKHPFKFADRKHLHHRLLDLGLSPKKTVLLYYAMALFFGLSALFLQSQGKAFALILLIVIMLGVIVGFGMVERKNRFVR